MQLECKNGEGFRLMPFPKLLFNVDVASLSGGVNCWPSRLPIVRMIATTTSTCDDDDDNGEFALAAFLPTDRTQDSIAWIHFWQKFNIPKFRENLSNSSI